MLRSIILLTSALCAFFCFAQPVSANDYVDPEIKSEKMYECGGTSVNPYTTSNYADCIDSSKSAFASYDSNGCMKYKSDNLDPADLVVGSSIRLYFTLQWYSQDLGCNGSVSGARYTTVKRIEDTQTEKCPPQQYPQYRVSVDLDGKKMCQKVPCSDWAGAQSETNFSSYGGRSCSPLGCEVVTNGISVGGVDNPHIYYGEVKYTGGYCPYDLDENGNPLLDNDNADKYPDQYVESEKEDITPSDDYAPSDVNDIVCAGPDCGDADIVAALNNINHEQRKLYESQMQHSTHLTNELVTQLIDANNNATKQMIEVMNRNANMISGPNGTVHIGEDGEVTHIGGGGGTGTGTGDVPGGEEGTDPDGGTEACPDDTCQRRDIYDDTGAESFFESNYEEGLKTIWDERMTEIQDSKAFSFIDQFKGNYDSGTMPEWRMCFNLGPMGDYGCQELALPAFVWAAIKAFILFGAAVLCRALIFGG